MSEENTAIVVKNTLPEAIPPRLVVNNATEQAKALMDVVEKQQLYKAIEDKKYLRVEAWQFIGAFNGSYPVVEYTKPVYEGEKIIAYESKVNIMKNGEVISSGIMQCGIDEFVTQGKVGYAKHVAAQSMAQTRAESKASRLVYSFIAVLGGYQPTPAEEMETEEAPEYGICPIHDVAWQRFTSKDKKQVWFSHRTDDGKYCNKAKIEQEIANKGKDTAPTEKSPENAPQTPKITHPVETVDWEKADGKEFDNALVKKVQELKWTPAQAKNFLFQNFNIANSRGIKPSMRNEVMTKLNEQIVEVKL